MKNKFQKIPLILSALIFLMLCFVFIFIYKKTNNTNKKAQADTTAWTTEARRRNDIISLDSSLKNIEDDKAKLETHFAQSSNIVPFLDTIEKLGPSAGAATIVDSVNTGADGKGLIVQLTASGSFESIYKFLTLLENSPYELDFLSMDIHTSAVPGVTDKNAKGPKWQADFKIQLLSFIQ